MDTDNIRLFKMGYTAALCDVAAHFIQIKHPDIAKHILAIYEVTREKAADNLSFSVSTESKTFKLIDQAGSWDTSVSPEVF